MDENKIQEFLVLKLSLSDNAIFKKEAMVDPNIAFRVDYFIEDKGRKYFVDLKPRGNVDSIAQLVFLKEWLKDVPGEKRFVLAGKQIIPRVAEIGKKMEVEVLELPYDLAIQEKAIAAARGKFTSEKSWRVIARILREKGISIRRLSIEEKVSYAWTHATVQNLLTRGIAAKKGNYVVVKDIPLLLNAVAWERPLENLFYGEINVDYDDVYEATKDLTNFLKNYNIQFSFTSYTAAGQYSGYGRRYDTLYMYIERDQAERFKKEFGANKGVKLRLYLPDRDVFKDSHEIDGIKVVSLVQAILDMSGLGYSGRDITKAMVDEYANK